jgi:hypothetical protein
MRTLITTLLLLLTTASAFAADVTVTWDYPYEQPDSFSLYVREDGVDYDYASPVWTGTELEATIPALDPGKTYYAVCRANVGPLQSADSNEIAIRVPNAPEGLQIKITVQITYP